MHAVIGTFSNLEQAEEAVAQLQAGGFSDERIGVLSRGYLVRERLANRTGDEALSGAGAGALTGSAIGGLLGLLAGGISMTVPVAGPLLAGGILTTFLGGAAAGAVYGGLAGVLIGLGISREEAKFYAANVEKGGIMIFVEAQREEAAKAWRIMRAASAQIAPGPTASTHQLTTLPADSV